MVNGIPQSIERILGECIEVREALLDEGTSYMVAMCEEGETSRRVSPQEFIEKFIRRAHEEMPEPTSDPGCLMVPCHVNLAPEALGLCDACTEENILSRRLAEIWKVPLLISDQEIVVADGTVAPVIGKARKLLIFVR